MSVTIYAGNTENSLFVTNENAASRRAGENERDGKKTTIYAGDLGVRQDSIAIKKKQAQKQAMKVLGDVFDSEKKIDQSMDDMTAKIQQLQEENLGYYKELSKIESMREQTMEAYGVTEDSEELPSGYQEKMLELEKQEDFYREKIAKNQNSIKGISSALADTKIERLKSHPMVDAAKEAEDILEAANKEIYGELVNEGRKHIEEKMEEEKEKAEKRAEKKEEEEERKAKKEEREALQEEMIEKIASDSALKPKLEKEIEEILDELKLVQEDLKGAAVDKNI